MHEKKDYEKERRPERVKQHRASAGFDELAQTGKIPIDGRCACRIARGRRIPGKPTARRGEADLQTTQRAGPIWRAARHQARYQPQP